MPPDSINVDDKNDENENFQNKKTEMEEIKTKTESQEIPDKVTHVTMRKIKNDAVGNCDIDPTCNILRLETEKTENIGPLETEAAFNN